MQTKTNNADSLDKTNKPSIKAIQTGLFVNWNKSEFLIRVVQDMLRSKFGTYVTSGPQHPVNNVCELVLHAFDSGAKFAESKDLLERYLRMIDEAQPNVFIEKKTETIDLDSDDEVPCITLDDTLSKPTSNHPNTNEHKKTIDNPTALSNEVIDLDKTESFSIFKPETGRLIGEVISLDESHTESGYNSPHYIPEEKDSNRKINTKGSVLQITIDNSTAKARDIFEPGNIQSDLNDQHKKRPIAKRKRRRGKNQRYYNSGKDFMEFPDDEVIVLNDSISSMNSNYLLKQKQPGTSSPNGHRTPETSSLLMQATENSKTTRNWLEVKSSYKKNRIISPQTSSLQESDLSVTSSSANVNTFKEISDISNEPMDIDEIKEECCKIVEANVGGSTAIRANANDCEAFPAEEVKSSCPSQTTIPSDTKPSSSNLTKKASKLSYKRPAHLETPLTQETSGKSQRTDSTTNIYNPNAGLKEKKTGLRPIVIDGNNIAISHGKGQFSLKGIQICINYFEKRGHRQIKAFIPQYRTNKNTFEALHKMEQQGTVVITPSRKVDGKTLASYDDRFIVQYAAEFGGVIVSTDNYRDLLEENPDWKETIEKRLLMFTWVDDLLMFPQDPLGRKGPTLDEFLKFPED